MNNQLEHNTFLKFHKGKNAVHTCTKTCDVYLRMVIMLTANNNAHVNSGSLNGSLNNTRAVFYK